MYRDAHIFREWLDTLLIEWGMPEHTTQLLDGWIVLLLIVILALLGNAFMRWGVVRSVRWVVQHTKAQWDNFIFSDGVISRLCAIVTPVVLTIMLPLFFASLDSDLPWLFSLLTKIVDTYMLLACVRFVNSLLRATFNYVEHRPGWHNRPIKGLLQTGQVLLACVTLILAVAIFIDKSPAILLSALGASAAVLMLTLAPKAPAPLAEVPNPRCSCTLETMDDREGILTQKTSWDSASFNVIPLSVTLIWEPLTPLTVILE